MGNGNRKQKPQKVHSKKKTPNQVAAYKGFLGDPQNQPDGTIGVCNQNLTGSDFLHIDESAVVQPEKPVPPPFGVRIKRFFQANGIWALIITMAVSFICWTVINIHENDIAIERLSVKIEYVEKALDRLDSAGIDTKVLDDELAELKKDMESAWKLDLKEVENQLDIINLKIEGILSDMDSK